MTSSPLRVLIAGGGVGGLEALIAARELAADRVALTLVSPGGEFVYRPLTTAPPYSVGRVRGVSLQSVASDVDASLVAATLEAVDADDRTVLVSTGERIGYDALVLALGAEAHPAVEQAMTWDDRVDSEMIGGLLRDVEEGYAKRLAVVIPPGPAWPLRGYEVALFIAMRGYDVSPDVQMTIIRPPEEPLALLGERALGVITGELERAGIAVATAEHVDVELPHQIILVLEPSGQRLEVDRLIAMPILRGRRIAGLPADDYGLVPIDAHCRVEGLERVWAVGDCTSFPAMAGGVSAEQADVAASDVAATAGANVKPRSFDPRHPEGLVGLPAGRYIEERLEAREPGLSMHLPTTGLPVLTYLRQDLVAGWRGEVHDGE